MSKFERLRIILTEEERTLLAMLINKSFFDEVINNFDDFFNDNCIISCGKIIINFYEKYNRLPKNSSELGKFFGDTVEKKWTKILKNRCEMNTAKWNREQIEMARNIKKTRRVLNKIEKIRKEIKRIGSIEKIKGIRQMSYYEQLEDPRWQKTRLKIFERDKWCCLECKAVDKTLCCHHICYIKDLKVWKYPDRFLKTLCRDCNKKIGNNVFIFNSLGEANDYFKEKGKK